MWSELAGGCVLEEWDEFFGGADSILGKVKEPQNREPLPCRRIE